MSSGAGGTKFQSEGILTYGNNSAQLLVDQGIAHFYLKLIPKAYYVCRQRHPAHITVVRGGIENPWNKDEFWGKYEGKKISFSYENFIFFDGIYWYLDAWSDTIKEIRLELGLPEYRLNKSSYHITLGNNKSDT